jgi:hypothetical protein
VSLRTWWHRTAYGGGGLAQLLARHQTRVVARTPPPSPPEQAGDWSWTCLLRHPQCPKGARILQLGPPPPLRRHPTLVPLPPDPRLGHGKPQALSWQQPGRTVGITPSRFLLLRSRPVGGPSIWRRRRDLGSRRGRSPGKQMTG